MENQLQKESSDVQKPHDSKDSDGAAPVPTVISDSSHIVSQLVEEIKLRTIRGTSKYREILKLGVYK